MKRRALLRHGSIAAAALLAGCTGDGTDGPAAGGSPTPSPTASPSPTPASPTVANRSFDASKAQCGQQVQEASVAAETADGYRVVVTGTTHAPNPCHVAELASVTLRDEGTLAVAVATAETDAEMCAQCIAEIDYEATVALENGLPKSVVVTHDGERVTSKKL